MHDTTSVNNDAVKAVINLLNLTIIFTIKYNNKQYLLTIKYIHYY
jgi:hypothetical protein